MFERWLIAKGNVFAPNWETLIHLVSKLKEEGWLVGGGTAHLTVERGEPSTEPIPDSIERAWLDDEAREELRMVWGVGEKSPLTGSASAIEVQRAPDFVYPIRKGIGMVPTECRCGEDLSFEWDEDELTPTFEGSQGIYTECEECSRTFDPAKGMAKLTDPVTKQSEEVPGGAAYRFAIKVTSDEPTAFGPDFLAFMAKEFNRTFYEVGAQR